jgi:hypothetical protein
VCFLSQFLASLRAALSHFDDTEMNQLVAGKAVSDALRGRLVPRATPQDGTETEQSERSLHVLCICT